MPAPVSCFSVVCSCHTCVGQVHIAERACSLLPPGSLIRKRELLPVARVSLCEILALVKNNIGHNLFEVASGVNKTAVGD